MTNPSFLRSDPPWPSHDALSSLNLYALDSVLQLSISGDERKSFADQLAQLWGRCSEGPGLVSAGPVHHHAPSDGRSAATYPELTQAITQSFIASQAGRLLMLHAGAVCHPDTGESLVFVAPGGTGKTTLARLLSQRMGYLTDETVGLRPDHTIASYPKPLSIRMSQNHKEEYSPGYLNLLEAHPEPRVCRLVLLSRDVTEFTIEQLSLADAIVAIAPETSSLSSLAAPLEWLADLYERVGGICRFRYREATDVAEHVWSEFGC